MARGPMTGTRWPLRNRWKSVCSGGRLAQSSARASPSRCGRPATTSKLAVGFLHGEGIVANRDDVVDVAWCVEEDVPQTFNIVTVTLRPDIPFDVSRLDRHFYTTSSCGICGKATLEALEIRGCEPLPLGPAVHPAIIQSLPAALRRSQEVLSVPAACMPLVSSTESATCWPSTKTLAATTRSTSSIGAQLMIRQLPAGQSPAATQWPCQLELAPEGTRCPDPDRRSRWRPQQPGRLAGRVVQHHAAGFRSRGWIEHLHRCGTSCECQRLLFQRSMTVFPEPCDVGPACHPDRGEDRLAVTDSDGRRGGAVARLDALLMPTRRYPSLRLRMTGWRCFPRRTETPRRLRLAA